MTHRDAPRIRMEPVDHHDPLGRSDYLSVEHVERYRFAAASLPDGARVLDIACGAGYGTAMLAERGYEVVGGDCDPAALRIAAQRFPDLEFVYADALDLPFAARTFDAVVTFETIEHVPDGAAFLREMARVLRSGGILLCSTPNVAYTAHPDYHLHEFEPEEFFSLVETEFGNVARHGQYFRARDRLGDLYRWNVKPRLLSIADAIGVRGAVRRARAGSVSSSVAAVSQRASVLEGADGGSDGTHRVRGYRGAHLLRIMVAVARSGGAA